jgi:hypothetical protein
MKRFNLKEKAEYVGTLRTVNVLLMEMLARWVPSTPEMEVKVLLGRHLWDLAQHADLLGKRVFELRAPLHYGPPLSDPYRQWLQRIAGFDSTQDRLAAFYECLLPAICKRHEHYLQHTDRLQDEPTVRIIERIRQDQERMHQEHAALIRELPTLAKSMPQWVKELAAGEGGSQFLRPEAVEFAAAKGE